MWWLEQQGPWCPALLEYLGRARAVLRRGDLLHLSVRADRARASNRCRSAASSCRPHTTSRRFISIIYKELFTRPKAIAFNTEVEKAFLKVDVRHQRALPKKPSDAASIFCAGGAAATDASTKRRCPQVRSCCTAAASTPARAAISCWIFFGAYKEEGGPATLVLMGAKLMPLPDVPWVRYAGLLSEADRLRALEAATIVVVPSPFESLSLLALEGMAVGKPVLCNAHADVLVDHCRRSQCRALLFDARGIRGVHPSSARRSRAPRADGPQRQGVRRRANYSWNVIMAKYDSTDGGAAEGMNATLLRRVVFAAIFLAAFGIYVMRASTSGALREPPETGDGHDYDAIAYNVWQGRGFGYQWSDEDWRKPYEGIPRYRLLLTSTVRVLSHDVPPAGDAVSALGGLCDHGQKLHRVARRQLRGHGRRRDDGRDHVRAVCRSSGRGASPRPFFFRAAS